MGLFSRFKTNSEDEDKDNFKDLEELISRNTEIILESDIILGQKERREYKEGIVISSSIVIDGNGHTIDANKKSRIFMFTGGTITIKNLKLINGTHDDRGGAIFNSGGTVEFVNCEFIDNQVKHHDRNGFTVKGGGGAINNETGQITLTNTKFFNNVSKKFGGAIFNNCNIDIINCEFKENNAKNNYESKNSFGQKIPDGGGGAIFNRGQIKLIDTIFYQNKVWNYGSAIYNLNDMSFLNCDFEENRCEYRVGTIFNGDEGHIDLEKCKFIHNQSEGYRDNVSGGGAIWNKGQIELKDTIFSQNFAHYNSGTISHLMGHIKLINCEFKDDNIGGDIVSFDEESVTLENSNANLDLKGLNDMERPNNLRDYW